MVDFLAIGAHPDDVELGAAGFLLRMKDLGYKTAILDLTRGEMGSRGSVEIRTREALASAKILGLKERRFLDLRDSRLELTLENRHKLAKVIRELKPTFLIAPYFVDKHPDHAIAGQLVKYASFDARLKRLDLGAAPHPIRKVFYYPCHQLFEPSFVIDITGYFPKKQEIMKCYSSQFSPYEGEKPQDHFPVGFSDYLFQIESRNRHFGNLILRKYGEGFICEDTIKVDDPHTLL